jgi:hypothetical protein
MPTFVQANIGTTPASTLNLPYTSNNTAGNFLVACVRFFNTGNATYSLHDSQGNVWYKVNKGFLNHGLSRIDTWYSSNCNAGANTVTITCTNPNNPNPEMAILEYIFTTTAALEIANSAQSSSNSNSPNSGNVLTSQAVELLIGFCCNETVGGLINTPAAGWTSRASDGDLFVCDQVTSSAGTYAFSSTLSSSVAWGAYISAFRSSPASQRSSFFIMAQ